MNILLVADEVAYTLTDSDSVALVVWGPLEAGLQGFDRTPHCQHVFVAGIAANAQSPPGTIRFNDEMQPVTPVRGIAQTASDDTAVTLYTSGTTGRPKGAELTHSNLFLNAQCTSERIFSRWPHHIELLGPGHVALAALPLYHSFGQTAIQNGMLFAGGAVRYQERFDAHQALTVIQDDQITFFAGVPTMYFALLEIFHSNRYDVSSLRYCISGGAALPIEVKRSFEQKFQITIQEAYGLSETAPLACIQEIERTSKAGSIGRPIWGVEMIVADDNAQPVATGQLGEILIRGHNIMKGYYKQPDATSEAMRGGWFHSGDIGMMDEDGDFYVVDRKKDLIIRGGFNVYPREVEEMLYEHPAIREAAVLGVSDPKYGEEIKAVVSLQPGKAVTEQEIIAYSKQRVAAYKYPRIVEFVDSLPKGPTGKILRRKLKR